MIDFNKPCFDINKITIGFNRGQILQMNSIITKTVQLLFNWNQQCTKCSTIKLISVNNMKNYKIVDHNISTMLFEDRTLFFIDYYWYWRL